MSDEATAQVGTGEGTAAPENTETTSVGAKAIEGNASQTTGTLAGGADGGAVAETVGDQKVVVQPQKNWRDDIAGSDEVFRKQLERYADFAAFGKAHRALLQRMSSGELKANVPFPENGTPEEQAAWRKEQGLPDNSEKYVESLALPNGMVLGELDKPVAVGFAEAALAANVKPDQYSKLVAKYYELKDAADQARHDADIAGKESMEDELRAEWGDEYRVNRGIVGNLRELMPPGLFDAMDHARAPDGTKIGNHPGFLRWMVWMGRELGLRGVTQIPPNSGDIGKSLNDRKAELDRLMADRQSEYYKGPNAAKLQAEWREVYAQLDRMKSRAA